MQCVNLRGVITKNNATPCASLDCGKKTGKQLLLQHSTVLVSAINLYLQLCLLP
jgi:hypothetical protein